MNNWADRSGEVFIKTKIVPADDKEILEYGISQGLFLVFNLLIFFGICCYFKIIIWGFIFLVYSGPYVFMQEVIMQKQECIVY